MNPPLERPDRRPRLDLVSWLMLLVLAAGFLALLATLFPAWAQTASTVAMLTR